MLAICQFLLQFVNLCPGSAHPVFDWHLRTTWTWSLLLLLHHTLDGSRVALYLLLLHTWVGIRVALYLWGRAHLIFKRWCTKLIQSYIGRLYSPYRGSRRMFTWSLLLLHTLVVLRHEHCFNEINFRLSLRTFVFELWFAYRCLELIPLRFLLGSVFVFDDEVLHRLNRPWFVSPFVLDGIVSDD